MSTSASGARPSLEMQLSSSCSRAIEVTVCSIEATAAAPRSPIALPERSSASIELVLPATSPLIHRTHAHTHHAGDY